MIENVQRRATKLIPGYFHLSYPEHLRKLKMPTLSYRRTRGDMIQVFKLTAKEGATTSPCHASWHLAPMKTMTCVYTTKIYVWKAPQRMSENTFSQTELSNFGIASLNMLLVPKILSTSKKNLDSFWENQPLLYDDYTTQIQTGNPKFVGS